MRATVLLALLWPVAAGAETLADTHFDRNFCWSLGFDRKHLEANPGQRVISIALDREGMGIAKSPGVTVVEVRLRLRDEGDEMVALSDCRPQDEGLYCRMDGRAGDFRLDARGESAVLLTVGERGMSFEGDETQVLRGAEGEERAFVLGRCR